MAQDDSSADQMAGEQSSGAGENPLNLPANMQIFGKNDPNVRKATAVVNGQVITGTDVDQRAALVVAASKGEIPPDEMQRVRMQVLRNLIDETLEIQAAKADDITVSKDEIDQTYARVAAQNFRQSTDAMDAYLKKIGSSPASLKRQIEGEMAWQRLLSRNVAPFVNVSNDEVNELLQRLEASRGQSEYRLGEIFLSANPETQAAVEQNARKIIEQLRQGGSFVAYARQFSEASTAAVGGDLGFVRLETLPAELASVAKDMEPGQLVGPVPNSGGYSILYLIDKRQVLTADPRDAVLSLKQISYTFPAGMTQAEATPLLKTFAEGVQKIKGCGDADAAAKALGAQIVTNDQIQVRQLPEQLQSIMLGLQVGQTTPPFGSVEDGVRVLMLCGRDDPQTADKPSFDELMNKIQDERINKRAQRYLRDLRNDAYIEYT
ncbi:MAG: peptidylprolyl isomerase [Tsuneonella sp.]